LLRRIRCSPRSPSILDALLHVNLLLTSKYLTSQGALLFGTFLNVLLYGISVAQVYLYFITYKRYVEKLMSLADLILTLHLLSDQTWLKICVGWIVVVVILLDRGVDPTLLHQQVLALFLANTLNSAFEVYFTYNRIVFHFGLSLSPWKSCSRLKVRTGSGSFQGLPTWSEFI